MRHIKLIGLLGLLSTTAYAAPYSYDCEFKTRSSKAGVISCEIEGTRDIGSSDPLRVDCSDGYDFFDSDTDGEDINDTDDVGIWGLSNGESDIVALVIRDFSEDSSTSGEYDADVLLSSRRGDAVRLQGECDISASVPVEVF